MTNSNTLAAYQWIFLMMFMACSVHVVYAQKPVLLDDFKFSSGEKYKRIKSTNAYLFASGDYVLSLKKGRKDMTIQRYTVKDLKEDVKMRQSIEDKGDFQTAMKLGEKVVAFYTVRDKLYGQKIAFSKIVAEKPILIGSDKENIDNDFGFKSTYGFDAGGRINKFGIKKSKDGSKIVVVFRIKTEENRSDKIGVSVYSSSLAELWSRKVTMPYPSSVMEYEDFMVTNRGEFYMTAFIFNTKDANKNKFESLYTTEVYKIKGDAKEIIGSAINLPSKVVSNAVIEEHNGAVKVAGFYADNQNREDSNGVFVSNMDSTGKVSNTMHSDFPAKKIEELLAQRETRIFEGTQDKEDKRDFENIRVNEIVFTNNTYTILGEQRYVEAFTTSSSSGSRTSYKYYYRDIVAVQLSDKGAINWVHKLPKSQLGSVGKRSMSYIHSLHQDKHYLFFVDDFTNLKRSFEESPQRYYDGKKEFIYLTSYVIDNATGQVTKEAILTGSDIRNSRLDAIELSKYGTLSDGTRIFEVYDGKKSNLLVKILYAQ